MIQDYCAIIKCEITNQDANGIQIKYECYKDHFIKYAGVHLNPGGAMSDIEKNYKFTDDYMNFAIQIETRKKTIIYHLVYKIINGDVAKSSRTYELINNKKKFISEENLGLTKEFWAKNFYEKVLYTGD